MFDSITSEFAATGSAAAVERGSPGGRDVSSEATPRVGLLLSNALSRPGGDVTGEASSRPGGACKGSR